MLSESYQQKPCMLILHFRSKQPTPGTKKEPTGTKLKNSTSYIETLNTLDDNEDQNYENDER